MIALLCFVLAVLAAPFKSKILLEAENAALRHQLIVLRLRMMGRARSTLNCTNGCSTSATFLHKPLLTARGNLTQPDRILS